MPLVGLCHPPARAVEVAHRHIAPVSRLMDDVKGGEHLKQQPAGLQQQGARLCAALEITGPGVMLPVNHRFRFTLNPKP
jgi:hypothetical protein